MLDKAKKLLNIINASDGEARFVGGAVRNQLLGLPTTDVDIATNLTPTQVSHVFEMRKIRVIPTGINYGTVTVVYDGTNYEVTTLRNDVSTDGRHAVVSYTDNWQQDASRRDFTFNALYLDEEGKLYDFFNGQEDLKNGIVRFIGNAEDRIKEDYLRILRMFRFHAYYGKGSILPEQIEACKKNANGLEMISGERIRTEMLKLLIAPHAHESLSAMLQSEILTKISLPSKSFFEIDKITAFQEIDQKPSPIVALSAILRQQITESKIDELAEKWRLSNREKFLLYRLKESLEVDFNDAYEVRKLLRISGKEEFQDYILVNFAKAHINKKQALNLLNYAKEFVFPEFPLRSQDLLDLGVPPGNRFGKILREAEEIWERAEYKLTRNEIISKLNLKN